MLGLRTTIYKVSDIQKATEWYSKAFETNPYYNEPYGTPQSSYRRLVDFR